MDAAVVVDGVTRLVVSRRFTAKGGERRVVVGDLKQDVIARFLSDTGTDAGEATELPERFDEE